MFNKMLLWKEIKGNRLVLILGILVPVASSFVMLRIFPHDTELLAFFNGLAIYPLFALFIGASLISTELATDTLPFLLSNPVKRWKVWMIKFLAGVFCICFVILVSALLILLITKLIYHKQWDFLSSDVGGIGFLSSDFLKIAVCQIALFYAIGLYCSVLFGEPMRATVVGLAHAIVIDACGCALAIILNAYQLSYIGGILSFSAVCLGFFLVCPLVVFVRGGLLEGPGVMLKKVGKVYGAVGGSILLIGLIIHTCFNYSASKELERIRQEIKVAGGSLTLEDVVPPAVPDDENAAIIYQKAFTLMQDGSKEEKKTIMAVFKGNRVNWSDENVPLIRGLVEKNEEALKLIREATLRKMCRFPIAYEDGADISLQHLGKMRQCARLLAAKALLQSEEGKVDEAVKTCQAGFRMGKSLHPEPFLISQLVRIAINSIMVHALELILGQNEVSLSTYSILLKELGEVESHEAFTRCLEGESLIYGTLWMFDNGWRYGGFWMRLYASPLGRPFFKKDKAFYLRMWQKKIALSRLPYYESIAKIRDFDKELRHRCRLCPFAAMLAPPSFGGVHVMQARSETQIRACKLALALRIHKVKEGRYPESLGELKPRILSELPKDPFTGKDYIYSRIGEGFIIYSVGENLIDEDGVFDRGYRKFKEKDDIVWRCEK